MNKERLQEIKDSIDFQREVLIANNMRTLCMDEEQELYDEVVRLNNVINELEKWLIDEMEKLHNISGDNFTTVGQKVYQEVLDKLKELKEEK